MTDAGRGDYVAGNHHFESAKFEEAVACYERAIAAAPTNPSYRYNRGLTYMVLGQYHKALEDLHVALEIEPDKADIRFVIGEVRSRLGERNLALANFKESLAKDPTRRDVRRAIERLSRPEAPGDESPGPRFGHCVPRTDQESGALIDEPVVLSLPTVAEIARPGGDETLVVAMERALRSLSQNGDSRETLRRAVLLSALHRRESGPCWERALEPSLTGPFRTELLGRAIRAYYEAGDWDEILRLHGADTPPPSQLVARLCAHALIATGHAQDALPMLEGIVEPSSKTLRVLAGVLLALGEDGRASEVAVRAREAAPTEAHGSALASIVDRSWFSRPHPLDDMVGLEELKTQVRERIVLPLLVPELYLAGGISNKFLMMGPPGCGKTSVARLAAREAHARLRTIHLTSVLNMFTGNSEANLTALFMDAKDATAEGPVVLLIDEVDSIAARRDTMSQAGEHRLVNHFMDEIDQLRGFPQLVVIATTNLPFDMDSAVLRSGRLGSPLYVGPPGFEARKGLIERQLVRLPHDGIDSSRLARDLRWYSPADFEQAFVRLRYSRNARRLSGDQGPLSESEVRAAFQEIVPSVRNWLHRAFARVQADPSLSAFVVGDLAKDFDELQRDAREGQGTKETSHGMFQ